MSLTSTIVSALALERQRADMATQIAQIYESSGFDARVLADTVSHLLQSEDVNEGASHIEQAYMECGGRFVEG